MTFSTWIRVRRRTLATIIGAVLAATVAGAALGVAGATLTGGDGARAPSGATAATQRSRPHRPHVATGPSDVRVRIISVILHPAGTVRGRSRRRARVSVHARVTNRGHHAVAFTRPRLRSGAVLVKIDAHAVELAGGLLAPLAASATADGVLRYETAGAVTGQLTSERRVTLRIAGRTIRATVKLGNPAKRVQ